MGNEKNRLSFFCKASHDFHQFFDFLRGQNCRRFIEYENFIVSIKHLQYFNTLLHSYRNILNQRIWFNHQSILIGQRHDLFSGRIHFQETMFCCLYTQNNILQYREIMNQFKMLMYHSDAQFVGIIWIVDFYFFSLFFDCSFFWLIQSEQDTHEG